jgi:hypothetical protein
MDTVLSALAYIGEKLEAYPLLGLVLTAAAAFVIAVRYWGEPRA